MLRLVLLTVTGLFAVAYVFGSYDGSEVVGTAEAADAGISTSPLQEDTKSFLESVGFALQSKRESAGSGTMVSEDEAIRIALERGAKLRAEREKSKAVSLTSVNQVIAVNEPVTPSAADTNTWRVTGTRVNLRSGPGTGHEIVGRAGLDDRVVPLSDTSKDWIEIRMSGGATAWIFGKFLSKAGG